ncbi:CvpA family protein [Secundilactobacillus folii]|nr:CvpA family protein [Secundilactobacillus folii]
MIFSIVILIILLLGIISGFRRGFVGVVMSLLAYIIAWIVAALFSQPVAKFLFQAFTSNHNVLVVVPRLLSGIVFFVLFSIAYGIVRRIGRDINMVTKLPVIHSVNALLGAAINLIVRYLLIFLVLNVLILFPSEWIQEQYQASPVAQTMVKKTPIMTKILLRDWQEKQVN